MKSSKSILFAIIAIVILVTAFAACSAATDEPVAENTSMEDTTASTTAESTTAQESEIAETENETEQPAATSETGGKSGSSSGSGGAETAMNKKDNTTKKQTTTKKQETTTKKKVTTTKKQTTTQKNVSAKEVQDQVNSYIRSKGITVDSSMTPSNSSWSGLLSASQKYLNNGTALNNCKVDVDFIVNNYKSSNGSNPQSMYCYFDVDCFYILYL